MAKSTATTEGIKVTAESVFVPERSTPEQGEFFFAYRITIVNEGDKTVQLMTRYWRITDGAGEVHEVRGDGVVGAQPRLAPGESFAYTSACPLHTEVGTMQGSSRMEVEEGGVLEVEVAPFTLAMPNLIN